MYPTSPVTGRCLNPGDDGSGCEYGGTSYAVGAPVPVLGCGSSCACAAAGKITCATGGCVPCVTERTFHFTLPSGQQGNFYGMQLTAPGYPIGQSALSLYRFPSGSDAAISCSVPFAMCGAPDLFDISDLIRELEDADVQQALSQSPAPFYGDKVVSSTAFSFSSGSSGAFSVVIDHECVTATAACVPTPPGVHRLVADLVAMANAGLQTPACASVR